MEPDTASHLPFALLGQEGQFGSSQCSGSGRIRGYQNLHILTFFVLKSVKITDLKIRVS
jgi:hypothetical protein